LENLWAKMMRSFVLVAALLVSCSWAWSLPSFSLTQGSNQVIASTIARQYNLNETQVEAALEYLSNARTVVNQDSATALYIIGRMYAGGYVVQQDWGKAVQYWQSAASYGNADAMYWLGRAYQFGHGVEKNQVTALTWYVHATEKGNQDSTKILTDNTVLNNTE
jgi:TPR repeat protein